MKRSSKALRAAADGPLGRAPSRFGRSKGGAGVTMTARKTGEEAGVIELSLLGHFKAEIPVGKQAD